VTGRVEYVGFAVRGSAREYALRVWQGDAGPHDFTMAIPTQAFLSQRLLYQDGPAICFLKLQRELVACAVGLPPSHLGVTDSDLEEYRIAHTPKAPRSHLTSSLDLLRAPLVAARRPDPPRRDRAKLLR
jgi:hypothetical protein